MNNWENVGYSDLIRNFFARKPKEVDGVANTSAIYYRQWMLKKIFSRFEILNAPANWEMDYFWEHLFLDGYIAVTDTELGVLPLQCGITGINVFNHPTEVQIANPILGSLHRTIGEDCEIIKCQYDFHGINWLLDRYSALLAMCDSSISVNLLNTKATFIFGASSKAQAETYKKMYDDITMGKPAVFVKEDLVGDNPFYTIPAKQNYIADDVQLLKRKIINEFLTDIGINNSNLDKRERLTDDEVNANNEEVIANIQNWIDNINEGLEKVNFMFGYDLKLKVREYGNKEGEADEFTEYD